MESRESGYTVRAVMWNSGEGEEARKIRFEVFVDEQKVPADEELDAIDERAFHVVAFNEIGSACGTARLFADTEFPDRARIGRMAVLKKARGTGCGSALLRGLLDEAKLQGFKTAVLSAQTHAREFYERHGFTVAGEQFEEAGIAHFPMERQL